MITILHGEDIASSRKFFIEQKTKSSSPLFFDGEKLVLTDLVQAIEGGGLFSDTKDIFIENLLSKRKKGKELEALSAYLKQNESGANIVLWESKELSAKAAQLTPKTTVKLYKLAQVTFLFLDTIAPGKGKQLVSLFHQVLKTQEAEFVFFMLIRQFRLLLGISTNSSIDEVTRLAPWQKGKLQKQASLFSKEQLITLYHSIYDIDLKHKTGELPLTFIQAIDFFLLEI